VYGDLRDANFVILAEEPERIMLIDYGWGGEYILGSSTKIRLRR
jgi:hypothetical protein